MDITLKNVSIPYGFEATGEYRAPKLREYSLSPLGYAYKIYRTESAPCIILRKVWEPPAWLPDGCWVYVGTAGDWRVSKTCPGGGHAGYWNGPHSISAQDLAILHGNTFCQPPCNKIQVKKAN